MRLGLSAGRVQSVAVKLIVEREREIQRFQQVASYRISAEFTLPDGRKLPCHLSRTFATEDEAREFLAACRTASFHVAEVQRNLLAAALPLPSPPARCSRKPDDG